MIFFFFSLSFSLPPFSFPALNLVVLFSFDFSRRRISDCFFFVFFFACNVLGSAFFCIARFVQYSGNLGFFFFFSLGMSWSYFQRCYFFLFYIFELFIFECELQLSYFEGELQCLTIEIFESNFFFFKLKVQVQNDLEKGLIKTHLQILFFFYSFFRHFHFGLYLSKFLCLTFLDCILINKNLK